MKSKVVFAVLMAALCSAYGATVRTATEGFVTNRVTQAAIAATNYTDAAIAAIPAPDYSPTNAELRATIEAVAPAPGDYAAVSNAAMSAAAQTNDFLRLAGGGRISTSEYDFIIGYDRLLTPRSGIWWQDLVAPCGIGCDSLLGNLVFVSEGQWIWLPNKGGTLALRSDLADAATAATNYTDWAIQHIVPPIPVFDVYAEDVTNVADFVTSAAISTNNAAFVEAVRSTPLAGADQSDLAEIGEYGSYGTVGAAILALIAGLAALKRRIGTAETAISGKADAADLRYRIAEAAVRKTLPADCFPVTFTYNGDSYSASSLVKESEASAAGDMFIMVNGTDYSLTMVESPATGSEPMSVIEVATFSAGGVFVTSGIQDLQFGGVSPVADTSPTLADIQVLADRTVNRITASDETSIDIELPGPVEEPTGVRRARDFFLDVDNSANANDLALEFVSLGTGDEHGFAFATDSADSIGEIMTIGAGECVRLYFTETSYWASGASLPLPVIHVTRVTLGDFVTSTTTTQGGN